MSERPDNAMIYNNNDLVHSRTNMYLGPASRFGQHGQAPSVLETGSFPQMVSVQPIYSKTDQPSPDPPPEPIRGSRCTPKSG